MKQLFLVFLALSIIASSCKQRKNKGEESKTVFRYNEAAGITSLDPAFARSFENIAAVNQVFNGLVQMDEKLQVKPCIAKSWEVSNDGKVYTFHLRSDVFFHDDKSFTGGKGRRVVASDFAHSFYRIIDPKVASPGAWIFNEVDFSEASSYSGFNAVDDSTLIIYLKNPFPPFLGILTTQYCSVVPHEAVSYYKDDFTRNPIGTGPFRFKTWKEGMKLVLVKNENYFEVEDGKRLPYLDAVSISFNKDRHSEFLSFIRGEFDMISGIDASFKDELLTTNGTLSKRYERRVEMQKSSFLKTDYLGFLVDPKLQIVKESPLRIKEIRQAINYGFNRKEMVQYLRNNIGVPASAGFIPQGMPSFDKGKVKGYQYDPEKARQLLEKAGYPNGNGLQVITLSTTAEYQDLSEFIQKQLQEIGFKIKIDVLPPAIYADLTAHARLNFFRKSWVADYPDAENYLALFYSKNYAPGGPNYTHFKNAEYDRLYEQATVTADEKLRFDLYHRMDQIIVDEAPIATLFYDEAVRFHSRNVKNLEMNPMKLLVLKRVKKEE